MTPLIWLGFACSLGSPRSRRVCMARRLGAFFGVSAACVLWGAVVVGIVAARMRTAGGAGIVCDLCGFNGGKRFILPPWRWRSRFGAGGGWGGGCCLGPG